MQSTFPRKQERPFLAHEEPSGNAVHPPTQDRGRLAWLPLILIPVAALLLYWRTAGTEAAHQASKAAIPTVVVQQGTLERLVVASGTTAARRYASITVPTQRGRGGGDLALTRLVAGGAVVQAGEMVAELDPQRLIEQLSDIEDAVSQSEADLSRRKAQLEVEWMSIEQSLESAKAARDRAALDHGTFEVRGRIEQEQLQLALEEAEAVYQQQLNALALKRISIDAGLRIQQLSHDRLIRRRDRMANDFSNYVFRAPVGGVAVIGALQRRGSSQPVQFKVGDQVGPGQTVLTIVDTSEMLLTGRVNQADSNLVAVGQAAKVTLDAYPGLSLAGKLTSVASVSVPERRDGFQVSSVPVAVTIQDADPRLLPDLSGAAWIVVGRRENATLVPLESLFWEAEKPFVHLRTDSGFQKQPVEVGLQNHTHAEIVSGLAQGQVVATADPGRAD